MLVIDGNGLPLGFHLNSANTAEVRLAEATLDTISVPPPARTPQTATGEAGGGSGV
jgi:hypothetical protein